MKTKVILVLSVIFFSAACVAMPIGNTNVPEPLKSVELKEYLGKWYEIARYENRFEKGCEAVTAEYSLRKDGLIKIVNSCREGAVTAPIKSSTGKAKVVHQSNNAKLKVSFFGPFFFGNYWVLDHADDYSWSIVGEPSGKYLWILARKPHLKDDVKKSIIKKVEAMGYNTNLLRQVSHQ